MATTPPDRSWDDLVARARKATPPDIDVSRSVLAALRKQLTQPSPTFAEELAAFASRAGVRLAVIACIAGAAALFYHGSEGLNDLTIVLSFSF